MFEHSIEDLRVEPVYGQPLVDGYLGITSQVKIRGIVKFKVTNKIDLTEATIQFKGVEKTRFRVGGSLLEQNIDLYHYVAPLLHLEGPKTYTKGDHELAFEIEIDPAQLESLPASFESSPTVKANGKEQENAKPAASIEYELKPTLSYNKTGMFKNTQKTSKSVLEPVDLPRLGLPSIANTIADSARQIFHKDDFLDLTAKLSSTVMFFDSPTEISILQATPCQSNHQIKAISASLVQIETWKAHDQETTFENVISESLVKPFSKMAKAWHKLSGQCKPWSGTITLTQSEPVVKDKKGRVKVAGSFESDLISVKHEIQLVIKLHDHDSIQKKLPMEFLDIDKETRDWGLRQIQGLAKELTRAQSVSSKRTSVLDSPARSQTLPRGPKSDMNPPVPVKDISAAPVKDLVPDDSISVRDSKLRPIAEDTTTVKEE
ncbi:hypothetical protein HDV01_007198 [Terramyces sp. JEL0728]|nr:hypothetical protein HDV01_007198 [Terramyces sp. JEL0728]